jgi:hypothetical protein
MLAGYLILNYNPSTKSIIGAVIAILAMIAYAKVNLEEVAAAKAIAVSRQREHACNTMHKELSTKDAEKPLHQDIIPIAVVVTTGSAKTVEA